MSPDKMELALAGLRKIVSNHSERILLLEVDKKYTRKYLAHICKLLAATDSRLTLEIHQGRIQNEKLLDEVNVKLDNIAKEVKLEIKPLIDAHEQAKGAKKLLSVIPIILSVLISLGVVFGGVYVLSEKMTKMQSAIENVKP